MFDLLKVLSMGRKRTAKVQAFIETSVKAGRCLNTNCDGDPEQQGSARGVCPACFQAFRRKLMNRTPEEQFAIEVDEIREGRLLDRYELRRMKKEVVVNRKRSHRAG